MNQNKVWGRGHVEVVSKTKVSQQQQNCADRIVGWCTAPPDSGYANDYTAGIAASMYIFDGVTRAIQNKHTTNVERAVDFWRGVGRLVSSALQSDPADMHSSIMLAQQHAA